MGVRVQKTTGAGGIGGSLETPQQPGRRDRALFLTWAIMGLWHGANWTFVLWGLYHATVIFLERRLKPVREKLPLLNHRLFTWALTTGLAMLSWIPFRAVTLSDALSMYGRLLDPSAYTFLGLRENFYLVTALWFLTVTLNSFWYEKRVKLFEKLPAAKLAFDVAKFTVVILLVFTFLRPISQFIYFQF
jgi:hypothetical protein